jgi:hypothetical protein
VESSPLDRRRFQQLVASAFGGLVVGSTVGCSGDKTSDSASGAAATPVVSTDKHACRGLNECKGKGADGKNTCAGQGVCANVAEHACGGMNECRNQGGCGKVPGANECKGQGGCMVPLAHDWQKARDLFEARMKTAGKTFGTAPPEPPKKKES